MPKRFAIVLLASALVVFVASLATAQQGLDGVPSKSATPEGTVTDQPPRPTPTYAWTDMQWKVTLGILAFSGLLFIAQFAVMFVSKTYWTDLQFKAFTLTLILTAGLVLIIAGFTDSQIAPMMGLIGTIAGYVLGSSGRDGKSPNQPTEPETEPVS